MHRFVNCRSNDVSTSSKTSRNVVSSSSLGRGGKREGDKGNGVIQDHTMRAPPPKRQPPNPPRDVNQYYDTSDSDDCESVGSNSPALNDVNETFNNNKNSAIDKNTLNPPIHHYKAIMKENLTNSHAETRNSGKMSRKIIKDEGHRPESTVPISKNSSNDGIPHQVNNNTYILRSNKELPIGGSVNDYKLHPPNSSNKMISRIGNTNHSSKTRDALIRNTPRAQQNHAKSYKSSQNVGKPDDNTGFDEGDGGGPPANNITSQPHVIMSKSKKNIGKPNDKEDGGGPHANNITGQPYLNMYGSNNNRRSHLTQDKNEKSDLESFDEGDGGGVGPHPSTERSYLKVRIKERHRRRTRHGMQSRRGSSSKSSRTRGTHKSSRRGRRSRGSSRSRSSGSSSGSRRSRKGRRRKSRSRGGSHQNSSRSSHHSGKSYHSSGTWVSGLSALRDIKPYPSNWRCFGRRPPAIHEFRPLGEGRVKNVRPAGKLGYLMRNADAKRGCQGPDVSDAWDTCYGLAKTIIDEWSTPLPYGTQVVRVGDIDPFFHPSRGDIVVINPAQTYYRAMKSGYVLTYRGRDYSFRVGDLVVRMGRFMPNGEYIPYGNLELYMHTQTREMRLLGRQPFLLVDFNYHNLDYESPGKHLEVGTFLNESFFPRRGDIIIRGGAWAENYPNAQRKHHSSVKYWRPRMEFLPNDMLLRPYVDIGRKVHQRGRNNFYWGAAELYSYSGKGLAWAYWGRDHHICDTPYPREQEHGIKTGHHKDEVGHYGDYGVGFSHSHRGDDDCHSEHNHSHRHRPHGHQAEDDCHREHELSRHTRR